MLDPKPFRNHFVINKPQIFRMRKILTMVLAFLAMGLSLQAQSVEDALKPVTRTYAFTNATIIPQPGQQVTGATIVVKDGLIQAMGTNVSVPANAKVVDADSMFIYAGFIDGLSNAGVPRPEREQNGPSRGRRPDGVDPGDPPRELAGVTPENQVRGELKHDEKSVEDLRELGFTAAHVVPRGRMLPGKGSIILLAGESGEDMLLAEGVSQFVQFSSAPGVFPATIIGVMAKFTELYKQTEQMQMHMEAYAKNPKGMDRPERNEALEALVPVVNGELPVFFMAPDVKSIYRVMRMQNDLGFDLVMTGVKEAWHVVDQLEEKNVPVIVSLELPDPPKEKKKKEGEEEAMEEEMKMLQQRASERMTEFESQAATLAKAGIAFGFSTMEASANDIRENLRRMIKNGLTEEQALASLTTNPANMLGLSNSMGTLEEGKMGNLVVTDGNYFEEGSNVRFVMADGHLFEYEAKKAAAKGDPNASAAIGGNWAYTVNVPGQSSEGTLTLSQEDGEIKGQISNSQAPGSTDIENAALEGNTLTFSSPFSMGGQSLTLEFTIVITGDEMEGTVSVGEFGTFDVEGYREGTPE
jgi:imidazolonepropionase-like amidohydrolase